MLDDVILGVLLNEEQSITKSTFYLIKESHAGQENGIFHRLAGKLHQFGSNLYYMKTARRPTYQPLLIANNLCKQRIYLFIG